MSICQKIHDQPCVKFLKRLSEEIGLEFRVECPVSELKPVVVLSWIGIQPELQSIILNSHMDVVPVFEEYWTHEPFAADIDADGKIFARGAQDMKCVGMQYLGAIRHFIRNNIRLKRTLHCTFVPDEEIFGQEGLKSFIETQVFKDMNVGFTLDEGIASPDDVFNVYYAERNCWHVLFKVYGSPGHGSLLLKDTAAEKLQILLGKLFDYRKSQEKLLEVDSNLMLGDVTTVNVTKLIGGKQRNVLPPFIDLMVDMRLAVTVDHEVFENMLNSWCKEAGGGIEIDYHIKEPHVAATKIDNSNIFWKSFKEATDSMNLKIKPQVFPAGTDSSYIRAAGIPAIGFSPMIHTPILLHDHDEFLQADIYLKGIEIYKQILESIGNVVE